MLDVRLPMGVMFVILGAVLVVTGLVADPGSYRRALGININLWWGLVMAALGAAMLLLVWRARRAEARAGRGRGGGREWTGGDA